ncbi:cryptochrome DASH, chloroplastic/mitochondrial isoform X2 [Cryptomeria japonica]|uniref:cryptochrome DASH, chloroplastic/mitochondrial isoform X2 n=1 Tax=Cryptomeria japonica TaxID=3369 RepID=UPI0027DA0FF4|nr:cryptochrome DASH, chloroplastic/mitochondrial isoform X2 [Cryptomeria japonica]
MLIFTLTTFKSYTIFKNPETHIRNHIVNLSIYKQTRNLFLSPSILCCAMKTGQGSSACKTQDTLLSQEQLNVAEEALRRHSLNTIERNGSGTAIVWFRNDLRILDNEALYRAWQSSETVLPVYCIDPRLFGTTYYFGFPKTGELRAEFLLESLVDLKRNLLKRGSNLLIKYGKPEEVLPTIVQSFGAHTVYAQKETCIEEVMVEKHVRKGLEKITLSLSGSTSLKARSPTLQLVWGSTMYHLADLPFKTEHIPDVYTQFRKAVEAKCKVRTSYKMPALLGPLPKNGLNEIDEWGKIPTLGELGLTTKDKSSLGVMQFIGGESAALARLHEYFWEKDMLRLYKDTRNGMLGPNYSTKFSPWLAYGSISPRYINEEVKRYERERVANASTYWILFELMWRDYFRFISIKYGNSIFHLGVGNDPREDRYFSIPKQAQNYDPDGEYVAHWLPEIAKLPKAMRHFPGKAYTAQVVPLKFPNSGKSYGHGKGHLEDNRHDFSRHVTGKTAQSSRRDTRR